jgi:hypothetical protein
MVLRYLKWRNVSIWPGTKEGGVVDELVPTPTDEMEILDVSDSTEPPYKFDWMAQVNYTRGLNGQEEVVMLPFDDVVLATRVRDTLKLYIGRKVGAMAGLEIID